MDKIDDSRKKINEIDAKLAALFERRMEYVRMIALEKAQAGKAIFDPGRENAVLERTAALIKDAGLRDYAADFFRDMMEISKRYQSDIIPMIQAPGTFEIPNGGKSGYQGTRGSYTEQAFIRFFGEGSKPEAYENLEELFNAISTGVIAGGVAPYENSSTGGVNAVTDLLRKHGLYIKAETEIRIEHCLLGVRGALLRDIRYAYSHPQGLSQCSGFFEANRGIAECSYANTAFAARDVAAWGKKENAAIASKRCAELYGLDIIRENIQDNNRNKTRFILISPDPSPAPGASKTSILFTAGHFPGALYKILEPFYEGGINITRIESRPNPRRSFEYYFYLDFNGSIEEDRISGAMEKVRQSCGYFRILGSYKVM
ncbi:MAG: chorismate mutase [Clostridia bacterium]|nr:chorismate mutase [Clostridia bacterium]